MRPRIGITTSFNDGEQRLNRHYVLAIESAGGLPLIVPMVGDKNTRDEFARLLDGLVVTGGPAITDGLIGRLPDDIAETDPVRIESDKHIVGSFLATKRPVLGICYGMQLLNAVYGGSIYADVEAQRPNTGTHSEKRGAAEHAVRARPGTIMSAILGTEPISVNTRHIQAVASVGEGLTASLLAEDGCVEGVEDASGLILGVQFHPERMSDRMQPLFEALVERARKKDKAKF